MFALSGYRNIFDPSITQNRGLKFQQASARRPQTGPSEEEGGVQRSQLVVNGGKQPQAAPRLDPNQKQNVFAQPPNQPIHRAIVLNQGIPQPNAGSNITISNQEINSHVNRSHPEVALQTGGSAKEHSQQGVNRQDTTSMDQPDISALVASQLGLHPDVKIVSSTLPISSNTSKIECVPLPKSPRLNVKICIYPIQEDKWVSGSLKVSCRKKKSTHPNNKQTNQTNQTKQNKGWGYFDVRTVPA